MQVNNASNADGKGSDPLDGCWPHLLAIISILIFLASAIPLVVLIVRVQGDAAVHIGGITFAFLACGGGMIASSIGTAVAACYRPWAMWPFWLLQVPACVGMILISLGWMT